MLLIRFELAVGSILALAAHAVAAPGTIGQVGDFVLADLLRCWFARVLEFARPSRLVRGRRRRWSLLQVRRQRT